MVLNYCFWTKYKDLHQRHQVTAMTTMQSIVELKPSNSIIHKYHGLGRAPLSDCQVVVTLMPPVGARTVLRLRLISFSGLVNFQDLLKSCFEQKAHSILLHLGDYTTSFFSPP